MQWKSHRIGGMCAGAVTAAMVVGVPDTIGEIILTGGIVAVSSIGSLLPDIDHPNSKISRENKLASSIINVGMQISRVITQILLFFCFWISKKRKEQLLKGFEHRGIFHTLLMILLLYLLLGLVPLNNNIWSSIKFALLFGYLSHLLMDMLTVSGVKLFYPFINHSFHLLPVVRLHTGNQVHENIAKAIFIIVTIVGLVLTKSLWLH